MASYKGHAMLNFFKCHYKKYFLNTNKYIDTSPRKLIYVFSDLVHDSVQNKKPKEKKPKNVPTIFQSGYKML